MIERRIGRLRLAAAHFPTGSAQFQGFPVAHSFAERSHRISSSIMSGSRWQVHLKDKTKKAGSSIASAAEATKESVTAPKHRTNDDRFNELHARFDEQRKKMEALQHDIVGFLSGAEAILLSMEQIAQNTLALCPPTGAMRVLCDQQIATVKRMRDDKRNNLEPQLLDTFQKPLGNYMGQYREITNRIVERNRRGDEMDKLAHQKDKQAAKGDVKLAGTQTRYDAAKQAYEDLNAELIQDMPKLVADTENFFQPLGTSFPLVALFIVNQAKFWQAMSAHVVYLSQTADLSKAYVPPIHEVITPKMNSAMVRRYQAAANPWGAPPGDPYAAPGGDPYGAPPPNPYGAPQQQPYGAPQQQYANNPLPPVPQAGAPVPSLPPRPGMQPPLPPRTPQAKALWDFAGQPGELSFKAGEIINVQSSTGEWWQGEIPGRGAGAFPGNYVQMLQ